MLSFGDSRYGKGAAGDQQRCDGKRASCVARCGDDVFGVGCIAVIFCILVTVVVAGIVLVGLVIVLSPGSLSSAPGFWLSLLGSLPPGLSVSALSSLPGLLLGSSLSELPASPLGIFLNRAL